MGLFDSSIDRRLNHNNQLIKLSLLIDWNPIKTILEKVHKRDGLVAQIENQINAFHLRFNLIAAIHNLEIE